MIDRPHAFGEENYSLLDNLIYQLRRRQVVRRLPKQENLVVADLGSGFDARLLLGILEQYQSATGVAFDIAFSTSVVENKKLTTVVGDLDQPLQYGDNTVDVALSLAVLEHLNQPQQFLAEAYRILKPGGILLLTTPGPSSRWLLEFLAFTLGVIDANEIRDHKNYFSSGDLQSMFEQAGFSAEAIKPETFIFGMNNVVTAKK